MSLEDLKQLYRTNISGISRGKRSPHVASSMRRRANGLQNRRVNRWRKCQKKRLSISSLISAAKEDKRMRVEALLKKVDLTRTQIKRMPETGGTLLNQGAEP
ncbi:hypothetical protein MUK42_36740 [Musa troglodytarum]|uniref:Uncharacterized protein n=1 Tax=Musa troglodytarum TaxID=320322 RepID=A0A9E7HUT8_9LILI|nr:hypothetical protein MUK42_36740 [Musa troglodytarum]